MRRAWPMADGVPNWRARATASCAVATARSGVSWLSARARWSCQGHQAGLRMPRGSRRRPAEASSAAASLVEAAGQQQFAVHGLGVREDDGGREGLREGVVLGESGGLRDPAAGQQDLDEDADAVPVDGGAGSDAFGEAQARAGEVLGLGEAAAPVAEVAEEGVAEGQVGAAPALLFEVGDAGGEEFLRPARSVAVHEGEGDQHRHLEAAVGLGPAEATISDARSAWWRATCAGSPRSTASQVRRPMMYRSVRSRPLRRSASLVRRRERRGGRVRRRGRRPT
jgi:hypothetical protein